MKTETRYAGMDRAVWKLANDRAAHRARLRGASDDAWREWEREIRSIIREVFASDSRRVVNLACGLTMTIGGPHCRTVNIAQGDMGGISGPIGPYANGADAYAQTMENIERWMDRA